jgi:amidohydrolase
VATVGTDGVVLSPQSMGGEDFGWFAEVLPIALARLGTHGGGAPLDLHRGTFDVDETAIGVGVRLLARTALLALDADSAPARTGRPAPGDTSARRTVDERREHDRDTESDRQRPADRPR